MSGCCDPHGYDDLFGARFSRHVAKRYRKRGLDRTASRMVDFLASQGIEDASVLEIGGGVGEIHLELLRRGAGRATNLELVDSYDRDAAALAADAGVADRVTRRQLDLATDPDAVEPHDFVVLHRVVCCYPDHQLLLRAAASHARRALVFSHPPRTLAMRAVFGTENLLFRARRMSFRTFVHDPDSLAEAARSGGFQETYRHTGPVWQVLGLTAG